jgi:two-component system OmpR family sensor kinase
LEGAREGGLARVTVADDGEGIPSRDLPHIFDPFYRSRESAAAAGHAGLGLAIAQRMVELQGGAIRAGSSPMGGAQFSFTLPLASR